jgi:hypothetical protein
MEARDLGLGIDAGDGSCGSLDNRRRQVEGCGAKARWQWNILPRLFLVEQKKVSQGGMIPWLASTDDAEDYGSPDS